jgi:hypothetical protein
MGVPHYTAAEDEDSLEAGQRLAQSYRAGSAAGGAGPHGSRMELLGVQGALPDIEALVRYHDQQIAASVLAQFMSLGQASGTGSYALGASFIDFFIMSLQSLAQLVADTATQHIVEDLVDVNFGTEVQAPRVIFDPIGQNPSGVVAAVQAAHRRRCDLPRPQHWTPSCASWWACRPRHRCPVPAPRRAQPEPPVGYVLAHERTGYRRCLSTMRRVPPAPPGRPQRGVRHRLRGRRRGVRGRQRDGPDGGGPPPPAPWCMAPWLMCRPFMGIRATPRSCGRSDA